MVSGSPASGNIFLLGSTQATDIDLVVRCTTNDQGAASSGLVGRYQAGGSHYRVTYSGGTLTLTKFFNGAATTLATSAVDMPVAGFFVHFQLVGSGVENLRASYWQDGEIDPGWLCTATDGDIHNPGQFGIRARTNATGDVLTFNAFVAQDPPPLLPGVFANRPFLDSPYGMTLNLVGKTPPLLSVQTMFDLLGVSPGMWYRHMAKWRNIEPNADQVYNWSNIDYAVTLCNAYGVNIVWCVQSPPNGYLTVRASDGTTVAPGSGQFASAAAWAAFVGAVAARYNGTVTSPISGVPMLLDGIQLANEEYDTATTGVGNNSQRDKLSQWLVPVANAAYPVIKSVHPTCRVGVGAVRKTPSAALSHITNWITNLYTYQGGFSAAIRADAAFFLDFHYYRDGTTNADGTLVMDPTLSTYDASGAINAPSIDLQISTILGIVTLQGCAHRLWNTEMGWTTWNAKLDTYLTDSPVVSQATDAAYSLAMYEAMRRGGGEKCFRYEVNPAATVTSKNLITSPTNPTVVPSQVSNEQKSTAQVIGGVYTYSTAYTDPIGGQGLVQEAARYPQWVSSTQVVFTLTDSVAKAIADYSASFVSPAGSAPLALSALLTAVGGQGASQTMGRLLGATDPQDRALLLAAGRNTVAALSSYVAELESLPPFLLCYAPLFDGLDLSVGAGGLAGWVANNTSGVAGSSGILNALFVSAFNLYAASSVALGYRSAQSQPSPLPMTAAFPSGVVDPLYTFHCGTSTSMTFGMPYQVTDTYGGGQAPLYLYKTSVGNAVGGATFTLTLQYADGTTGTASYSTASSELGNTSLTFGAIPLGIAAARVLSVAGTGMTAGEQYSIGARLVRPPAY